MLELDEIRKSFPKEVHHQDKAMVREYLQVQILKIIFESKIAPKLSFIGGTALRLIYNTKRFSEDLDFDNKNLGMEDWLMLGNEIKESMAKLGLELETTKTRLNDKVFHSNLRFPGIFFKYGISPHKNETLLIKVDSQDQEINYHHRIAELSKFDIRSKIKVMPLDVALSQKFRAFFDREMGRDLFDISSIAPQTKPNYDYLKQALNIDNAKELKERVLSRCDDLDFEKLLNRAKAFIFTENGLNHIKYFKDYMQQYEF